MGNRARRPLSAKQRRFIEVFDGNGTAAARAAGYKGSDTALATQAGRLLRKAEVLAAIEERRKTEVSPLIADRKARQQFWTAVMNDEAIEMKDRLKASELLGRSEADFVEKHQHAGVDGAPLSIVINRIVKTATTS